MIIPSLFAFSFVFVPYHKLNEWTPYGLKQKEVLVKQYQDKATKFAEEIEKITSQNIWQKISSKKEQKLLEKLSEYFNILQNDIIKA